MDELFDALMLVSGNDAATALAEANGGVAATVAQMNSEAAALGAYDTYVQTPSGLDGWQQLTSAYDMALVLQQAVRQPRLIALRPAAGGRLPASVQQVRQGRPVRVSSTRTTTFFTPCPVPCWPRAATPTPPSTPTWRRPGATATRSGVVLLRNSRLPLDQYQQAGAAAELGLRAASRASQPVGTLAGPIADQRRRCRESSLGSALAMAIGQRHGDRRLRRLRPIADSDHRWRVAGVLCGSAASRCRTADGAAAPSARASA